MGLVSRDFLVEKSLLIYNKLYNKEGKVFEQIFENRLTNDY